MLIEVFREMNISLSVRFIGNLKLGDYVGQLFVSQMSNQAQRGEGCTPQDR